MKESGCEKASTLTSMHKKSYKKIHFFMKNKECYARKFVKL